jgi:glycosyltransferase involved in cell wall biosynthesis
MKGKYKQERSMRIGIDATGVWGIKDGLLNGMMIYTIQIIKNLIKIDNENKYIIYCRDEVPQQLNALHSSVSFRILKSKNRKILQQIRIPVAALLDRLDLVFFPYHSAALVCPCTSIVTIHDLFPYIVPEQFAKTHSSEFHGSIVTSVINKAYWKSMLKAACKRVDRIIAVSQATKRDIVNIFHIRNEKIDVVYEGVDREYFCVDKSVDKLALFQEKYGLPEKYILCVGTHAYKNIEGIVKAFSIVRKKYQNSITLLIAGNKTYVQKEIFQLVTDLNLESGIIFTGFFPAEDLKYLYQCAEVFLFPSFYEGFGLPVLEAFACGTPVVTSNTGSLPEVGGEAALLVDPNDHEEIASAVLKILSDKTFRAKKRQQGFNQVEKFSWENAARMTLKVFNKTLEE